MPTYEAYAPEDIRDLISVAISDSMDLDWQPGWGAESVVKALHDAGLMIVPDLEKVCAENGYTYGQIGFHPEGITKGGWSASFHIGQLVLSNNRFDAGVNDAVVGATAAEPFDTVPKQEAA